jgi:hypothetical protein
MNSPLIPRLISEFNFILIDKIFAKFKLDHQRDLEIAELRRQGKPIPGEAVDEEEYEEELDETDKS